MVERSGFEPLTFSMPLRRATNCANAPQKHPFIMGFDDALCYIGMNVEVKL